MSDGTGIREGMDCRLKRRLRMEFLYTMLCIKNQGGIVSDHEYATVNMQLGWTGQ